MIHNHEVPGSIPGPATQERNVYRIEGLRMERGIFHFSSSFFVFILHYGLHKVFVNTANVRYFFRIAMDLKRATVKIC